MEQNTVSDNKRHQNKCNWKESETSQIDRKKATQVYLLLFFPLIRQSSWGQGSRHSRVTSHATWSKLSHSDIIQNRSKTSPKIPWPPTAKDLTLEIAINIVPDQLFNFVACTCGISMQLSDNKGVEVMFDDSGDLVSTCQNIITLRTKALMPKQCCLVIAVPHMTGSAQLLDSWMVLVTAHPIFKFLTTKQLMPP